MIRRGVTLVEMIMTIAVMAIVMSVVIPAFLMTGRVVSNEISRSELVVDSGRLLGPVDELLRQGKDVVAQYPTSGAPTVTTGSDAMVFTVPSIIGGQLDETSVDYVTLERDTTLTDNARLIMTVYPSSSPASERPATVSAISKFVSDLYIRYPTTDLAEVNAVTVLVRSSKMARDLSTQTILLNSTLRNH